jgi:hypothetical protein
MELPKASPIALPFSRPKNHSLSGNGFFFRPAAATSGPGFVNYLWGFLVPSYMYRPEQVEQYPTKLYV